MLGRLLPLLCAVAIAPPMATRGPCCCAVEAAVSQTACPHCRAATPTAPARCDCENCPADRDPEPRGQGERPAADSVEPLAAFSWPAVEPFSAEPNAPPTATPIPRSLLDHPPPDRQAVLCVWVI